VGGGEVLGSLRRHLGARKLCDRRDDGHQSGRYLEKRKALSTFGMKLSVTGKGVQSLTREKENTEKKGKSNRREGKKKPIM